MIAMRLLWIAAGTIALVSAAGQTRDTSQRAPAAPPAAGTAVISGVVTSFESPGSPVRRATVSLVSADLRVPVSTTTDDGGRFVFRGLAAGNYGIVASKVAFVGSFYGSTQPGRGPGVPVAVRDGDLVENVTLSVARGGVITGTARLPSGQPAQGMTVVATGVETVAGARRPILRGGRSLTNDRGEYRIYGLSPGDYVVQVQPSGFLAGTPSGNTDARQTSASEVSWAQAVGRRGVGAALPPDPAPGRTTQYARVFYPGTTDPSNVRLVTLDLGEERTGIDLPMELVATARVSGTVVGPDGAPLASARVTLAPADYGLDAMARLVGGTTVQSGDDGSFELPAIEPGRYRLSMRRTVHPPAAAPWGPTGVRHGVRALAGAATSAGTGGELWAEETLTVSGQDIGGLTLFAQPGLDVSGRLAFDSASRMLPSGEALREARVRLVPMSVAGASRGSAATGSDAVTAAVSADGTFALVGVVPGRYRIALTMPGLRLTPDAPGDGWSLRSIVAGGVDVSDAVLDVTPGVVLDGVVATFTDRPSELVGSLTDQVGRPAPGYPIVVFSTDREHWFAGSRRVAVARPATDGAFRLAGLPAGRYHLCAVVSVDEAALEDPSYLEQLVSGSLTITLTDDERTTQDLRLAGG